MVIGLIVFGPAPHSFAQQQGSNKPADLFEMSLEELMEVEVEVTSSARRPQRLARAASAVYVITAEDIRQAGVTHLGDLMRLVPGMDIAQVESNSFAMSARGLAKPTSSRIQILLDGRPLYDAGMGEMKFEARPIFLENIERIEVIRGAGGVIWGVNAMNGVNAELALDINNLTDRFHSEGGDHEVPRQVYFQFFYRF
jgi:iron complex outermembrane receptor protein